jgi:hypothetical protein
MTGMTDDAATAATQRWDDQVHEFDGEPGARCSHWMMPHGLRCNSDDPLAPIHQMPVLAPATVQLVVTVHPSGQPGLVTINVKQEGPVTLTGAEVARTLIAAAEAVLAG